MSSSQIAENYQLKWHSHLNNLNSSVATLFRNDKFADVLLFTSQMDGGCGIPAHKIILSSCSYFFAQVFDSNPSPPNSMVYIVLPPEISRRSIQILIQYMYSGEATVSNDILNEVLHGGELLKIRGLCRNKQAHSTPSMNESSSLHYSTNEAACDKTIYEHTDRTGNNAIIKESPVVVVTSPQHLSSTHSGSTHKSSSLSSTSSSSSATTTGSGVCPTDPELSKRNSVNYNLKSSMARNHCVYSSPTTPLHLKSTVHSELSHMLPPVQQITSSAQSLSSIHSPDSHSSSGSNNPNNMNIKKESMTINALNDDLVSVPASHYGLVSLQIAAAVKKAQQISEKRCANSTSHLYSKAHISNTVVNNHDTQAASELHGKHIENGNNSAATITTTATNNNFAQRYTDDYFVKDNVSSGSHLHHQQVSDFIRKPEKEQQRQKQPRINSTSSFDKNSSPIVNHIDTYLEAHQQATHMPDDLQMMDIKQEPEWVDFEHETASLNKSSIEVAVKPELIFSKGDTDEEVAEQQDTIYSPLNCEKCCETFTEAGKWVKHIESHAEAAHCVPKKRKHIETNTLSDNIAALRCDLCDMYFVTPAEWVRHVQNHTETELALSNNNASLRQSSVNNNTTTSASSLRSSRPQTQNIESSKYE